MKRVAIVYDTLEDLKNDPELQMFSYVHTLGKDKIGDGYANTYYICDEKSDESIEITKSIYATPFKTKSDLAVEAVDLLRTEGENELKTYIKNTIAELCDDIASEFVTKRGDNNEDGTI